jgi:hypothetical protein
VNTLLFSMDEYQVCMDGGYTFAVEAADYSVMYDIHKITGRRLVMIDHKSVKRQEWREGKAYWVAAQLDAPVLMKLEKQLQDEVDYETETSLADLADEYRRRA